MEPGFRILRMEICFGRRGLAEGKPTLLCHPQGAYPKSARPSLETGAVQRHCKSRTKKFRPRGLLQLGKPIRCEPVLTRNAKSRKFSDRFLGQVGSPETPKSGNRP